MIKLKIRENEMSFIQFDEEKKKEVQKFLMQILKKGKSIHKLEIIKGPDTWELYHMIDKQYRAYLEKKTSIKCTEKSKSYMKVISEVLGV